MIISSSNVNVFSKREYSSTLTQKSTDFKWTFGGAKQVDSFSTSLSYTEKESYSGSDNYDYLSSRFQNYKASLEQSSATATPIEESNPAEQNFLGNASTVRYSFLFLIDMIRNSRFKQMFNEDMNSSSNVLSLTSSPTPTTWNVVSNNSIFMEEKETTAFTSTGTVVTSDGTNISFNVSMEMSREFTQSAEFSYFTQYQEILTDPLVINLDSAPTEITDKTFYFDLDNDGKEDEMAQMKSNSGYLALDKNGDGTINNGNELFGTKTGNGFKELAEYDQDNNGWIDESDDVYSKLKVWVKDAVGKDTLLSLKDADVGAIYLGSSKTEFSLKDNEDNSLKGQVRQTGVYLHEDGTAGTVQQVDF